jgi:hypothetical protein
LAKRRQDLVAARTQTINRLHRLLMDLVPGFQALTEDVPFAPDDLPGYVGRLFDYLVEHPDVLRLATWAGLERPTAVAAFEADSYRTKLLAIADAQHAGRLDAGFAPADLLALALGVTGAWFTASEALRTHDSPNPWSPHRLAQFRAAAVQATTRILGNTFPTADTD